MKNNKNKVYFASLGCARNLVDTEVMMGILMEKGYEVSPSIEEADVLIVNTCGFLEESRQESSDTIDTLFQHKKKTAKVIVAGCMVQKYGLNIRERFPNVHAFLGSGDINKIAETLQHTSPTDQITSARSYLEQGEIPRQLSTPPHLAYLKIAEGCLKRCSFCIIPSIKGNLKSKSLDQVVSEFERLLRKGVFEIILIAQDLGDFGKDRKEKGGLITLLRRLLQFKDRFWLRLLYIYPDEINEELIELIKSDPRICPYLDMPIQHINDSILKKMRRLTSKEQLISLITRLRQQIPQIVIRTSLMVGFPGETESQFRELLQFIQDYPIDNIGIFKYSMEKESASAQLPHQITEEVKQDRFERLALTQQKIIKKLQKKYKGKTLEVMVEGYHPESPYLMRGRFYGQCPEIDGEVIIDNPPAVTAFGRLHRVTIHDISDYDLIGTVIPSSSKLNVI